MNEKYVNLLKSADALIKKSNFAAAEKKYKAALSLNPNNYNALYNISMVYKNLKDFEQSKKYALEAYKLNQKDSDLLLHLSFLYELEHDEKQVIYFLNEVIKLQPNNEDILEKLIILSKKLKNHADALLYAIKCLEINENNIIALSNIAVLFSKKKKYDTALKYINKALELAPDNYPLVHTLCIIYNEKRDWINAIETAKKLINLDSSNHIGYGCLADNYYESVDYALALEYYNKALEFKPNDIDYMYNKAACLLNLSREEEAAALVNEILKICNDNITVILLSLTIKLRNKKYEEARNGYLFVFSPDKIDEIRRKQKTFKVKTDPKFLEYHKKCWNNEDLHNKKILIWNNAGYGDYLMFSRYIPLLKDLGAKIIIETDKNLLKLYSNNFDFAQVVEEKKDEPYKDYDYSAMVMRLLYNLNRDFDNIPFAGGWFKDDKELTKKFANSDIFQTNKLKAGIFWHGHSEGLRNREIQLKELLPILECSGIQFYSIDIAEKSDDIWSIMNQNNIVDCSKYIKDFNDTASVLKNLDVLISVDSSVLHLGGALGVKTFLMLPKDTEWRWFKDVKTTPWYNSVTIFKQNQQSDWSDVVNNIKNELQNMIQNKE